MISCKFTKKTTEHSEIQNCARYKLSFLHKHTSEVLYDSNISNEEFDRIVEETDDYK